jgi:transcriptional regulator with XRE-family HTH domain
MILGDKIRERREELDMSQADLAKKADVSQATISGLENGKQQSSRKILRVVAVLGLKLEEVDSEYKGISLDPHIDVEAAELAFEVILESLSFRELTQKARKDLGVIFLELAHERLAGSTSEERAQQMRRRLIELLIEKKIQ